MEFNEETIHYNHQSYQTDVDDNYDDDDDDDDDGDHEAHYVETCCCYGTDAKTAKTAKAMSTWAILSLSEFVHEFPGLREW
jgi:hypothetical protein